MSLITKVLNTAYSFTRIDETKVFSTEIPLRFWARLDNITAAITNATVSRDLEVKYRYSFDALHFTDWHPIADIQLVNIGAKQDFIVDIQVRRIGADATGIVTLDSITILGDYDSEYTKVFDFLTGTIFEDILPTDVLWNKLWINLLKKLYKRGIIPEYIERGETVEEGDENLYNDEDYIVFWKVVAYFYAYLSELSRRKVGGLRDDSDYLEEYLSQKGLFICPECDDCSTENVYLLENIFDEFRKRGTVNVALKKSAENASTGEMLRMICYSATDEFLFEYLPRHLSGWNVNNTSPLYRGKTNHIQLNKAPENTKDVLDLTKYTLTRPTLVALATDGDKKVVSLNGDATNDTLPSGLSYQVVVDPFLSYEFTFWAKFSVADEPMLSVNVEAFLKSGLPTDLHKISGTTVSTNILSKVTMPNNQLYYFVRCIVYSKNQTITGDDAKTSIRQGENLKMVNTDTSHLKFTILNNGENTSLKLWDIKCRPLILTKSSVYTNSYNVMNVYLNNRNASLSVIDFEEKARRYLVPYGTIFQLFASPKSQFVPDAVLVQNNNYEILTNDDGSILV